MSGADVDAALALSQPARPGAVNYNEKDALLYAVGIGAEEVICVFAFAALKALFSCIYTPAPLPLPPFCICCVETRLLTAPIYVRVE